MAMPASSGTSMPPHPPRRISRAAIASMLIATLVVFLIVFSQTWFKLPFFEPTSSQQTLVLAIFSAVIFLLLLALTFILVRNVVKLYADRRMGVLGSKFRTRMVVGALVLSFTPVILMCFF